MSVNIASTGVLHANITWITVDPFDIKTPSNADGEPLNKQGRFTCVEWHTSKFYLNETTWAIAELRFLKYDSRFTETRTYIFWHNYFFQNLSGYIE